MSATKDPFDVEQNPGATQFLTEVIKELGEGYMQEFSHLFANGPITAQNPILVQLARQPAFFRDETDKVLLLPLFLAIS